MKVRTIGVLWILVFCVCNKTAKGNILHDIKDIIKEIFAGESESTDTKEVERVRKTMVEWKTCLGVQLDKKELDHINHDCDAEFDIDDERDAKKKSRIQNSACYRVCQLEELGWLHDSDSEHTSGPYFNHTAMEAFVKATFPEAIHVQLKKKISNCARAVDSFNYEKACKNYKVFFKCLDKAIHDKCKSRRARGGATTEAPGDDATTAGEEGEATTEGGDGEATTEGAEGEGEATTEASADGDSETTTSADE